MHEAVDFPAWLQSLEASVLRRSGVAAVIGYAAFFVAECSTRSAETIVELVPALSALGFAIIALAASWLQPRRCALVVIYTALLLGTILSISVVKDTEPLIALLVVLGSLSFLGVRDAPWTQSNRKASKSSDSAWPVIPPPPLKSPVPPDGAPPQPLLQNLGPPKGDPPTRGIADGNDATILPAPALTADLEAGNSEKPPLKVLPSMSPDNTKKALSIDEEEENSEAMDHAGPLIAPIASSRSCKNVGEVKGVGEAASPGPLARTLSEQQSQERSSKSFGPMMTKTKSEHFNAGARMTKTKSQHRPPVMKTRSERPLAFGKTMSETTSVAVSNLGGGCRKVSLTIPSLSAEMEEALNNYAQGSADSAAFGSIEEDQSSKDNDDSEHDSDNSDKEDEEENDEEESAFGKSQTEPAIRTQRKDENKDTVVAAEASDDGDAEDIGNSDVDRSQTEPPKKSQETATKPFIKPEGAVGAEELRSAFTSNLLRKGLHLGAPMSQERYQELQVALELVMTDGVSGVPWSAGFSGIKAPIGSARGSVCVSVNMSPPALSGVRSPAGPGQGPPKNPIETMARLVSNQAGQGVPMQQSQAQSATGSHSGSPTGGSRRASRQGSAVPSCTGSRRGSNAGPPGQDGTDRRRSVLNAPNNRAAQRRPSGITAALAKIAQKALPTRVVNVFSKYSSVFRDLQDSRRMVKSVNDLAEELETGGCRIEGDENQMKRIVSVCNVRVVGPKAVVLIQKWQRDEKGKWRRKNALPGTKMKNDEDAYSAVQRVLSKDLPSIKEFIRVNRDAPLEHLTEEKESKSYPGVFTQYNTTVVEAVVETGDQEVLAKMGLGPNALYKGSFLESFEEADVTYVWAQPRHCHEDEIMVRGERGTLPKISVDDSTADPESENDAMFLNERFAILARTLAEQGPQHLRSAAEFTDIGFLRLRDLVEYLRREQEGGMGTLDNTEVTRELVYDMLTTLNGGQPPRHCMCKPGEMHTCMSPAASLLASFAPSLIQSKAPSMFQSTAHSKAQSMFASRRGSTQASRRGSTEKLVRLSVAEGEEHYLAPVILGEPPMMRRSLPQRDSTARGSLPLNRDSHTARGSLPLNRDSQSRKSLTVGNALWNEAGADSSARASPALWGSLEEEQSEVIGEPLSESQSSSHVPSSRKRVSWDAQRSANGANAMKTTQAVAEDDSVADTIGVMGSEAPCINSSLPSISDPLVNLQNLETMPCMSRESFESPKSVEQVDELAVTIADCFGEQRRKSLEKRRISLTHRTSVWDVEAAELPADIPKNGDPSPRHSFTKEYNTVSDCQLAEMLQSGQGVLVVDVRGRDFKGGHIPGAMHVATSVVLEGPEEIAEASRRLGASHVVFTCMYSVLRAPRCAAAFARHQQVATPEQQGVKVSILSDGFHGWINHWNDCGELNNVDRIADFDPTCWQDCREKRVGEKTLGLVHSMDAVWSEGGQKELALALEEALRSLPEGVPDGSDD